MRARMALDVAGLSVEHREVLLSRKPAALLAASPKGTVPVLVLPDGTVLDESLDIMTWALDRHDPNGWRRDGAVAAAQHFLRAFKDPLDRYKYASRYDPALPRGAVDPSQRAAAMTALRSLAAPLDQHPYLMGETPSLLDVATFPFVRQFAAVEPQWWVQTAPPTLQGWLRGWLDDARFRRIMAKHPVWAEPESTSV